MRLAEPPVDIWIDAVFGTGLTRPLPGAVLAVFKNIFYERNWKDSKLIAVDILSGLHTDTGEALSKLPLAADLTVTFHRMKRGHCLGDGPRLSGKVVVRDIGL